MIAERFLRLFADDGARAATSSADDITTRLLAGIDGPAAEIQSLNTSELARAARESAEGFAVYGDSSTYFQVGRMKATAELIESIDPSGFARATDGIAAGPMQAIEQAGAVIRTPHPTASEMVRVNDAVLGWADTFASRLRASGITITNHAPVAW